MIKVLQNGNVKFTSEIGIAFVDCCESVSNSDLEVIRCAVNETYNAIDYHSQKERDLQGIINNGKAENARQYDKIKQLEKLFADMKIDIDNLRRSNAAKESANNVLAKQRDEAMKLELQARAELQRHLMSTTAQEFEKLKRDHAYLVKTNGELGNHIDELKAKIYVLELSNSAYRAQEKERQNTPPIKLNSVAETVQDIKDEAFRKELILHLIACEDIEKVVVMADSIINGMKGMKKK